MKDEGHKNQSEQDPLQEAKEWEARMVATGFYREHFFAAFTDQLTALFDAPISVFELGSGPGHLAEFILQNVRAKNYTLFDVSSSMNQIALERLQTSREMIIAVQGNFLDRDVFNAVGSFDAVLCMQTIHEAGDKNLACEIYSNIYSVLEPGGYFLVCDFICGDGGMSDARVYMTVDEQGKALTRSGFRTPRLASSHAGLTLWVAQK